MSDNKIYDFIGIGIGPFNLSLAALAHPIPNLEGIFFDQAEGFDWHPGMMLDDATLQVPFMADFVTMIDPTSPFSFLNYLRENRRIYQFYIRESFFILRKEYNRYCQWVVAQMPYLKFRHQVTEINHDDISGVYEVKVKNLIDGVAKVYRAEKLVIGTGTTPHLPDFVKATRSSHCIHSGDYLHQKEALLQQKNITIVGSGQSAAEIFMDLARMQETKDFHLNWFTRPDRFFPLEYSKLTLELTSPDYVDHFYHLPAQQRDQILASQNQLFKGINYSLINEIYDYLYQRSLDQSPLPITLRPCAELYAIEPAFEENEQLQLHFRHTQLDKTFTASTGALICCTGYKANIPGFLVPIQHLIRWDAQNRYDVHRNHAIDHQGNSIFVQNAELHTHGFVTPDLGLGAQRSATIINTMLRQNYYPLEQRIAFQKFGLEDKPGAYQTTVEANTAFSLASQD